MIQIPSLLRLLRSMASAYCLAACFFVAGNSVHAQVPAPIAPDQAAVSSETDYEAAREELASTLYQLRKVRAQLDESSFNPAFLAESLGGNPEDLFRFVRDGVAFQPYVGVMRNAQGALMSQSGNAFDQALLLAAMLQSQGVAIRFARAQLSAAQVAQHLYLQVPQPFFVDIGLPESLRAMLPKELDLDEMATIQRSLEATATAQMTEGYWYDFALLSGALRDAGVVPPDRGEPLENEWVEIARNHCWVQANINGEWVDLDPAAGGLAFGQSVTTAHATSDKLDFEELAHSLTIRMSLETSEAGAQPLQVLEQSFRLTGAINYLGLATIPENAMGVASLRDPEFLSEAEVFRPILRLGESSIAGAAFNLAGELVSDDMNVRNAKKVQAAQQKGFGVLGSAIDGIFAEAPPNTQSAARLEKVWLEFELVAPSGERHIQRRVWADRTEGAADLGDDAFKLELLTQGQLMASASVISRSYVATERLDRFLVNREALFAELAIEAGRSPSNLDAVLDRVNDSMPLDLLDLVYRRQLTFREMVFRDFPRWSAWNKGAFIVLERQGVRHGGEGSYRQWAELDIINNAVDAAALVPEVNRGDGFRIALLQGILDTQMEFLALGSDDTVVNTHSVIEAARMQGIELAWIAPDDPDAIKALTATTGQRAAMRRDSEAGYALVAPVQPAMLDGEARHAWWRINPVSGETLGMVGLGAGQALAEYKEAALEGAKMGAFICLFSNILFKPDDGKGMGRVGEYAKCVLMSAAGGAIGHGMGVGSATSWGSHFGRSGLFNSVMCALSWSMNVVFDSYWVPTGLEDGTGAEVRDGAGGKYNNTAEAIGVASCVLVGMAIAGGAYRASGGPAGVISRNTEKALAELRSLNRPYLNTQGKFSPGGRPWPTSSSGGSASAPASGASGATAGGGAATPAQIKAARAALQKAGEKMRNASASGQSNPGTRAAIKEAIDDYVAAGVKLDGLLAPTGRTGGFVPSAPPGVTVQAGAVTPPP